MLSEAGRLEEPTDPRRQSFPGLLSPLYGPLPTPRGHKPQDAWPWAQSRAVPGHPGQQLKHGVQHVAVALFQFEQPEQGKGGGHFLTGTAAAAPQHQAGGRPRALPQDAELCCGSVSPSVRGGSPEALLKPGRRVREKPEPRAWLGAGKLTWARPPHRVWQQLLLQRDATLDPQDGQGGRVDVCGITADRQEETRLLKTQRARPPLAEGSPVPSVPAVPWGRGEAKRGPFLTGGCSRRARGPQKPRWTPQRCLLEEDSQPCFCGHSGQCHRPSPPEPASPHSARASPGDVSRCALGLCPGGGAAGPDPSSWVFWLVPVTNQTSPQALPALPAHPSPPHPSPSPQQLERTQDHYEVEGLHVEGQRQQSQEGEGSDGEVKPRREKERGSGQWAHLASRTTVGVLAPCPAHPSKEPTCQPQQKQVCPSEAGGRPGAITAHISGVRNTRHPPNAPPEGPALVIGRHWLYW